MSADGKIVTVREMIAALSDMDPDLPVYVEGCDCIHPGRIATHEPASTYNDRPEHCLIGQSEATYDDEGGDE